MSLTGNIRRQNFDTCLAFYSFYKGYREFSKDGLAFSPVLQCILSTFKTIIEPILHQTPFKTSDEREYSMGLPPVNGSVGSSFRGYP